MRMFANYSIVQKLRHGWQLAFSERKPGMWVGAGKLRRTNSFGERLGCSRGIKDFSDPSPAKKKGEVNPTDHPDRKDDSNFHNRPQEKCLRRRFGAEIRDE
jgi:hypothetical protein